MFRNIFELLSSLLQIFKIYNVNIIQIHLVPLSDYGQQIFFLKL